MSQHNAVVIVVDRLGAGYLGPYGNTWVATPEMNRLASQSVLFENAIADTPRMPDAYRSLWSGIHAAVAERVPPQACLPALLSAAGVQATLVTDEALLAQLEWAAGFGEQIVTAPRTVEQAATAIGETQLAELFATAMDRLERAEAPFLLWIHTRGLGGLWDAPHEFRRKFAGEEDPDPPFVQPPDRQLDEDFDPDEVLAVAQAYAAQLLLLDICLGTLLQTLDELPCGRDTLLALTAPRGYPLGEHGRIGPCGDRLFGEVLHVPLLIRLPEQAHASTRLPGLVQPADLCRTLADWFSIPPEPRSGGGDNLLPMLELAGWPREAAYSVAGGPSSVRTPAWFFCQTAEAGPHLYAKPDDRWEVNEVSARCPEVAEALQALLAEFAQLAPSGRLAEMPPLSPRLRTGVD